MKPVASKTLLNAVVMVLSASASIACLATEPVFFARKAEPGKNYPFSEAVQVGDMLYLSGEVGLDSSGKLAAGGIKAETKQVMDNIGANLARHHSSFDRVVQCTVALADIAEWPAFNDVYKGYFDKHFPARMAYGASGLALGARVEIQCNAVVGK
jgi:2-iminobutanoate/2-iminopropanoate deaminase